MAKARWDTCLLKNKQGAYLPCLSNAVAILTHHSEWHNVIAFDAFAGVVVKRKQPPWSEGTAPETDGPGDWTHKDSQRAAVWLTRQYNCPVPTFVIDEAVQVISDRWHIHPVRDWANELRWDRKERVDSLLVRLAGAPDNAYVKAVTKNFFISAVARILAPGCQVDTMLILEGEQGIGKSSLLRILASDDWFLDTAFDIGSKDGYQALRRKWIVEMGELDAFNKAETSRRKQFISSVKDSYRPSYGRAVVDHLRQCVFVGTFNPDGAGYGKDVTGDRRSQPVTLTKKVNLKAVREERPQLWAEAIYRYRHCESWHLREPKLLKAAAREAEQRRMRDPWEERVRAWLVKNRHVKRGVTTEMMLSAVISMAPDKQSRADQVRAAHVLRALGWTIIRHPHGEARRYFPGSEDAAGT